MGPATDTCKSDNFVHTPGSSIHKHDPKAACSPCNVLIGANSHQARYVTAAAPPTHGGRGGCGVLAANCSNCFTSSGSQVYSRDSVFIAATRAGIPTPQPLALSAMEPGKPSTSARTSARHAPGENLLQRYKCETWLIGTYCRGIDHLRGPERQLTPFLERARRTAHQCSQAHCKSQSTHSRGS